MSCARLQAAISGVFGGVLLFAIYFFPKKKTRGWSPWRDEATKVERGRVRVAEHSGQHAASSRSGQVLQTLVGAQESFAVGTVVVHVLQGVHTEGDEAAARDAPQQAQAPAREPGEGTGIIGQLGHNHLVAGRTAHLDRTVKKGDGLQTLNG